MSHACPYCISGRIYVEAGSSQSYRCTDCKGTGVLQDGPIETYDEILERALREMDAEETGRGVCGAGGAERIMSKTPRSDAAWHAFNESASAIPFRDEMRKLEAELTAERETRRNAERVCKDALDARNRAEATRDKYIRLYELVRDENAKLTR